MFSCASFRVLLSSSVHFSTDARNTRKNDAITIVSIHLFYYYRIRLSLQRFNRFFLTRCIFHVIASNLMHTKWHMKRADFREIEPIIIVIINRFVNIFKIAIVATSIRHLCKYNTAKITWKMLGNFQWLTFRVFFTFSTGKLLQLPSVGKKNRISQLENA